MTLKLRLAACLLGGTVLALLIHEVGLAVLLDGARRAGIYLPLVVLLHLPVYCLNAAAWRLTMPRDGRPSFLRTLRITISAFSINFVTPVIGAGGEPYRAAALAPYLGARRATGTVVLYVMLHAVSSLLMWCTALLIAITTTAIPTALRIALGAVALAVAGALWLVLAGHRGGFVARLGRGLARLRLQRLSAWLIRHEPTFTELDAQIVAFHRDEPRRLAGAILLDWGARLLTAAEVLLIALGLGEALGYHHAVMVSGLSALLVNILFFFPFELGSREGGLVAFTGLVGWPVALAMVAALITRIREFTWAATGLLLVWLGDRRPPAS